MVDPDVLVLFGHVVDFDMFVQTEVEPWRKLLWKHPCWSSCIWSSLEKMMLQFGCSSSWLVLMGPPVLRGRMGRSLFLLVGIVESLGSSWLQLCGLLCRLQGDVNHSFFAKVFMFIFVLFVLEVWILVERGAPVTAMLFGWCSGWKISVLLWIALTG